MFKLHSEILDSYNLYKNYNLSPWIGEQPYIDILFWKFYNLFTYVRVDGKLLKQHFTASLLSNPGEKVPKSRKTWGQICPIL